MGTVPVLDEVVAGEVPLVVVEVVTVEGAPRLPGPVLEEMVDDEPVVEEVAAVVLVLLVDLFAL